MNISYKRHTIERILYVWVFESVPLVCNVKKKLEGKNVTRNMAVFENVLLVCNVRRKIEEKKM